MKILFPLSGLSPRQHKVACWFNFSGKISMNPQMFCRYVQLGIIIHNWLYSMCGNAVANLQQNQYLRELAKVDIYIYMCTAYVQIKSCNLSLPIPNFFLCLQGKFPSIRGINVIIPSVTADYTSSFDLFIRGERGSSQIYSSHPSVHPMHPTQSN